jgi:hypothetical protein
MTGTMIFAGLILDFRVPDGPEPSTNPANFGSGR